MEEEEGGGLRSGRATGCVASGHASNSSAQSGLVQMNQIPLVLHVFLCRFNLNVAYFPFGSSNQRSSRIKRNLPENQRRPIRHTVGLCQRDE